MTTTFRKGSRSPKGIQRESKGKGNPKAKGIQRESKGNPATIKVLGIQRTILIIKGYYLGFINLVHMFKATNYRNIYKCFILIKSMVSKGTGHYVYKDLRVIDLIKSKIPDRFLHCADVSFTSPAGNEYLAFHFRDHPKNPYILLTSKTAQVRGKKNI